MKLSNIRTCARCTYDETIPRIKFDEDGVCNYCAIHDELDSQYPTGAEGWRRLEVLAAKIKSSTSARKKYDCVVGVSGGCDSSFLLVQAIKLGLRPLAVHFDNTWNSPIATQNIYKIIEKLNVDLHTVVVDNQEFDDILRAFMLAGARDIEAPTDIGLTAVLYGAAEKFGIKYILDGHSFRSEGTAPLDWVYMDGRYVASVHKKFGRRKMKTFPNMTMQQFLRWTVVRGIYRVRPLYNVDYIKEDAKRLLAKEFGWEWYGGHHLENRFTAFLHLYALPNRWNADTRQLGHAALVRSGQLDRDVALQALSTAVECPDEIVDLVKKRLGFTDQELVRVMNLPRKSWRDFPNYKKSLEFWRPLFSVLVEADRVPRSFYLKYCFPDQFGGKALRNQPDR